MKKRAVLCSFILKVGFLLCVVVSSPTNVHAMPNVWDRELDHSLGSLSARALQTCLGLAIDNCAGKMWKNLIPPHIRLALFALERFSNSRPLAGAATRACYSLSRFDLTGLTVLVIQEAHLPLGMFLPGSLGARMIHWKHLQGLFENEFLIQADPNLGLEPNTLDLVLFLDDINYNERDLALGILRPLMKKGGGIEIQKTGKRFTF